MDTTYKNRIYQNKTWRFLSPCLIENGIKFRKLFDSLIKIAIGIYDYDLTNNNISIPGKNMFILIDSIKCSYYLKKFEEYIKYKYYYKESYTYSPNKQMIVLKIPTGYENAYDKFLEGKYSEMYTPEQLDHVFSKLSKEYGILYKSRDALEKFVEKINKEFHVKLEPENLINNEYELPPKLEEETFSSKQTERNYFDIKLDKIWS